MAKPTYWDKLFKKHYPNSRIDKFKGRYYISDAGTLSEPSRSFKSEKQYHQHLLDLEKYYNEDKQR